MIEQTCLNVRDSQVSLYVQALLMTKSKVTAREESRQDRERAKSLKDRSRFQIMTKAAQLQQDAEREQVREAAARVAKQALDGK